MVDWQKGEPQPSLRKRIRQTLEDQPDRLWTPPEMRGELFPDVEFESPEEVGEKEYMASLVGVAQTNAVIHSTMEQLVHEGILDKREFRLDQVAEIAVNEAEYEELIEKWPDDEVYTDRTLYRLAENI